MVINGKDSAWLETIEITPFVKNEDGTFSGRIIYALVDLKDKERIEKLVGTNFTINFSDKLSITKEGVKHDR